MCLPLVSSSCTRGPGTAPAVRPGGTGATVVPTASVGFAVQTLPPVPAPVPRGPLRCAGIVADGRRLRRVPRIPGREAFVRPHKRAPPARKVPRRGLPAPPRPFGPSPPRRARLRLRYEPAGAARRHRRRGHRGLRRRDRGRRRRPRDIAGLERAERAGIPTFVLPGQGLRARAPSGTPRSPQADRRVRSPTWWSRPGS